MCSLGKRGQLSRSGEGGVRDPLGSSGPVVKGKNLPRAAPVLSTWLKMQL